MRRAGPGPAAGGPCASPACGAGPGRPAPRPGRGPCEGPSARRACRRPVRTIRRYRRAASPPRDRRRRRARRAAGRWRCRPRGSPDWTVRCRRCRRVPIGAYGIRRSRNHIVSGRCHLAGAKPACGESGAGASSEPGLGRSRSIGQAPGAQRRQGVGIDRRVTGMPAAGRPCGARGAGDAGCRSRGGFARTRLPARAQSAHSRLRAAPGSSRRSSVFLPNDVANGLDRMMDRRCR